MLGQCSWTGAANGLRKAHLYVNRVSGGGDVRSAIDEVPPHATLNISNQVAAIFSLATGDYVKLWAEQNSGGNLNLLGVGSDLTSLSMIRLLSS